MKTIPGSDRERGDRDSKLGGVQGAPGSEGTVQSRDVDGIEERRAQGHAVGMRVLVSMCRDDRGDKSLQGDNDKDNDNDTLR